MTFWGATGQAGLSPARVRTKRRCPVSNPGCLGAPHPPSSLLPVWNYVHAYFLTVSVLWAGI